MRMRSPPVIASTATVMRCCWSALPRSPSSKGIAAMRFTLLATSGSARQGRLTLAHGVVDTPVFMPVGTYGTVKAMAPRELEELGAQIILGNAYHLWLRPGLDVIAAHQGLHPLIGWPHPVLPDSG